MLVLLAPHAVISILLAHVIMTISPRTLIKVLVILIMMLAIANIPQEPIQLFHGECTHAFSKALIILTPAVAVYIRIRQLCMIP